MFGAFRADEVARKIEGRHSPLVTDRDISDNRVGKTMFYSHLMGSMLPPYPADNSKQQQLSHWTDEYENGAKTTAIAHSITLMASAMIFAPSA
jgi:hypothetical protein